MAKQPPKAEPQKPQKPEAKQPPKPEQELSEEELKKVAGGLLPYVEQDNVRKG